MAQADSQPQQIAIAIGWLRNHFCEAFRIDDLARQAGMSTSGFHQWFRSITGMSPLQYQKQLRLQEARSILRNGRKDVGTVSRCVGYEAPHSSAGSTAGCSGILQYAKSARGLVTQPCGKTLTPTSLSSNELRPSTRSQNKLRSLSCGCTLIAGMLKWGSNSSRAESNRERVQPVRESWQQRPL